VTVKDTTSKFKSLNLRVSLLNLIGYTEVTKFSARVRFPELFLPFVFNKIALLLS
jgi:hypothetical protein